MSPGVIATTVLSLITLSALACATRTAPLTGSAEATARDSSAEWLNMFARGYFPGRSGQIFFVPHEGDFIVDKDPLYSYMHGSPWPYDAHIPLLFHGRAYVKTGDYSDRAAQQDVTPTIARVLAIAPPATVTGRALQHVLIDGSARPRVVAMFVLDGMRVDYFERYAKRLPTLTRLRQEGAWFSNTFVNTMPTATSIGHATLGTGADPRVHGLVVNQLFNRVTGRPQESYLALDPGELMALTLGDVWNLETDGRAIIIAQGGAIRATAGLVGHGACAINGRRVLAASYSTRDAGWETNEKCYAMPAALKAVNGERFWKEVDGNWLGHDIASPRSFRASATFQRFEGEALATVLHDAELGQDDITDLVFVNVKSPDYVSHAYGPASREIEETLAELDRQLTRALQILESKAGERLFITVTADHGMPGEPASPRRRIQAGEVVRALDAQFAKGGASVVNYFGDPANAQIHMNVARLNELGISLRDVAAFLQKELFLAVFTEDDVRTASARLALGR